MNRTIQNGAGIFVKTYNWVLNSFSAQKCQNDYGYDVIPSFDGTTHISITQIFDVFWEIKEAGSVM